MKKLILVTAFIALTTSVFPQTADEIIQKHIEAIGGIDNITDAKTVIMSGTVTVHGYNLPMSITFKRKQKVRIEISLQDITQVQAYDGKTGWKTNFENGGKIPEKMTDKETKDIIVSADFEGALVDYKKKGYDAFLLGKEKVDSADTYKIALSNKSDTIYYFINAGSYMVSKRTRHRMVQNVEINNYYKKYQKFQGIMIPVYFEVKIGDSEDSQVVEISKVEINKKVDDSIFRMPDEKN